MSRIVAALATVHAPFITGLPQLAPVEMRTAVYDGFARLRGILAESVPDVLVIVSSEHITNFLSTNVPPFCVGLGTSHACLPEFNLPEAEVPGDPGFARGLVEYAYQHGMDVAHSTELTLDHGIGLPLHFLRPDGDLPVVPVLQNTIWSPMHTARRAFEFGQLLRSYIDNDGSDRRVAVVGAGGISHWVGNARHGDLNIEFDEWFIGRVLAGDGDSLRSITQEEIDKGGDGANEIRSWISVLAAVPDRTAELVVGERFIPGWNVGGYQVAWPDPEPSGRQAHESARELPRGDNGDVDQ